MHSLRVFHVFLVLSSCCVLCTRRNFNFEVPSASASGDDGFGRSRNNYIYPFSHRSYNNNNRNNNNGLTAFSHQHVNFFQDHFPRKFDDEHEDQEEGRWLCLVAGLCGGWFQPGYSTPLNLVYEWSQLEFDYPNPQARQADISSGAFVPGRGAPIDTEVVYTGNGHHKIFVTIPRFVTGIPVTLGTISKNKVGENHIIVPFPNWSWHQRSERCSKDRLVSVFRVKLDECGRLWVLDTGRIGDNNICPPQIIAFDVATKQVLHRYQIPQNQYESRSVFVTPIVDVRDPNQCRDTFVYAADCQTYSIIVYDVKRQTSWRITNKLFYPFPTFGTYTISGERFELMDGVLGLSLEPFQANKDRKLYFHSLSSNTENWVYTSLLRNQTAFASDPNSAPEQFHVYDNKRPSQSAASDIDRNGIQYFGMIQENSIGCWNTATPYGGRNLHVLMHDDKTLQFASGVKIINNRKGTQELWVVTSRLQKAFAGTLTSSEINFRILAGKTEDVTKGTKCHVVNAPGSSGFGGGFGGGSGGGASGPGNFQPGRPSSGHY